MKILKIKKGESLKAFAARERRREYQADYRRRPERLKKTKKAQAEYRNRPEIREREAARRQSPEYKKQKAAYNRTSYQNKKRREAEAKRWEDVGACPCPYRQIIFEAREAAKTGGALRSEGRIMEFQNSLAAAEKAMSQANAAAGWGLLEPLKEALAAARAAQRALAEAAKPLADEVYLARAATEKMERLIGLLPPPAQGKAGKPKARPRRAAPPEGRGQAKRQDGGQGAPPPPPGLRP